MKAMCHVVNVMRPPKAHGTLGQTQGQPETIIRNWPCSIENLSGRELELARSTFAAATLKVEGYGDPRKPIEARDYLELASLTPGKQPRKLFVGFVDDKMQNGIELSLICGEER